MIAPDVNLLVYAVDRDSPFHDRAGQWLSGVFAGTEGVGFVWNVLIGFLRITTRPGILPKRLTVDEAFYLLSAWLAQPSAKLLEPGPRHFELLRSLLETVGTAGNLTSDAHLAAIAIEHDAEVCSLDGDFGRFPGVRWRNPLTQ